MFRCIRIFFIESNIYVLKLVLDFSNTIIDFVTQVVNRAIDYNSRTKTKSVTKRDTNNRPLPKVVIVGASFAGLATEQYLSRNTSTDQELDIVLIDYKEYFEYIPGILRCFVEPEWFSKSLACPLSVLNKKKNTTVLTGSEVMSITNVANSSTKTTTATGSIKNEIVLKNGQRIVYDYLVLATGSSYPSFSILKSNPSPTNSNTTTITKTIPQRQKQFKDASMELNKAKTILIIGAGAVGVELVGEIVTKYNHSNSKQNRKRIIVLDMASTILPGFHSSSVHYATKWLKKNHVDLKLNCAIKDITNEEESLNSSIPKRVNFFNNQNNTTETINVDLIYKCIGFVPNNNFNSSTDNYKNNNTSSSSSFFPVKKGPKGAIEVNDHLQVIGYPNIFCAGDLCYHKKSNEIKLGHTAELNGHLVAKNILQLIRKQTSNNNTGHNTNLNQPRLNEDTNKGPVAAPSYIYPYDVVGNRYSPKIYDISLGKYDATLGFNDKLVVHGTLAALVKWLIEYTKVQAVKQKPIGVYFWIVGDFISNLLSRTILSMTPTPAVATTSIEKKK